MMNPEIYRYRLRKEFSEAVQMRSADALSADDIQQMIADAIERLRKKGSPGETEEVAAGRELLDASLAVGPLIHLMNDPQVTEIMINGHRKTFIERAGRRSEVYSLFESAQQLRYTIERLMEFASGKRLDESSPYADISLPDGTRLNLVIPPVVSGGPHITVRKYLRTINTLEDLQKLGTIDERLSAFMNACVKARVSLLFSGATGSGKTTVLEVLSRYLDEDDRIVVIEDTLELRLHQRDVVRLLTREPNVEGKGGITIGDLFHNTLRMRPSRILLGEIRGGEALDYLQAINSGHQGSMAVIHAATPEEAIVRIENLVSMSGLNIPIPVIREQIVHGLNVVIQCAQASDGSRKISRVSEVTGYREDGSVAVRDIFTFEPSREGGGRIGGRFVDHGLSERMAHRFELAGAEY
jgi:pilus assembly protein CpaF